MTKNTNELGIYIKNARTKFKISQCELSRRANVDSGELSRIENGQRKKPNVLFLKGIAETLNLSMVKLMELAGYKDIEINFGMGLEDKRSVKDYQNAIQDYERFYFDVLDDINIRRNNDMKIKNIITDLIDKLEYPDLHKKSLTSESLLKELNKMLELVKPNLSSFDKSKYPKYDRALMGKMDTGSNIQFKTFSNINNNTDKE